MAGPGQNTIVRGSIELPRARAEPTTEIQHPVLRERRMLLAGGLAALAFAMTILVVAARSPNLGFFLLESPHVMMVAPSSAAARAGLRRDDHILSVGGQACGGRFCRSLLRALAPGDEIVLAVRRAGADGPVVVRYRPPRRLPIGSAAGAALGTLLLGIALLADRGVTRGAPRRFYIASVVYVILFAGAFSWDVVVLRTPLVAVWAAALLLAAPVTCHFALLFPAGPQELSARVRTLLYVPPLCVIAVVEAGLVLFKLGALDAHPSLQAGWRGFVFVAATALAPAYLAAAAIARWRRRHGPRAARASHATWRWALVGSLAVALPVIAGAISAAFDLGAFVAGGFAKYLAMAAVGGSLCLVFMMSGGPFGELDRVLRKGAGYLIATTLAAVAYVGVVAAVGGGFAAGRADASVCVVATLLAAAAFGPLRAAVQRHVDARFGRERERARQLIASAADAAIGTLDPVALSAEVVARVRAAMHLAGAALYEEDEAGAFMLRAQAGTFGFGDRLDRRDPVRERILHALGRRQATEIGGGTVAVPIEVSTRRAAALVVAPPTDLRLGREDKELLETLAKQLVVVLRNARAHAELASATERLRKQADIADRQRREIQRLKERIEEEARLQAAELSRTGGVVPVIGVALRSTYERAQQVATTDATVLIRGETGTGKELLAHAIHAGSPRRDGPFVVVDCGAIPEGLFESALFGHERGAFTGATRRKVGMFEAAEAGTLFLDEIGELPLELQPKLLGAIERRAIVRVGGDQPISVDVRIVAATNRRLDQEVAAGRFRRDLLYRLQVVELTVPPLRERRQDVPELCTHFLEHAARRRGARAKTLSPEALAIVLSYDWPGNVRELQHVLERAALLAEDDVIRPVDLSVDEELFRRRAQERLERAGTSGGLRGTLEQLERERLTEALRQCGGNRSQAARSLGIKRATLLRRMKRYGIG